MSLVEAEPRPEIIYYKAVKLVSPERAKRLSLAIETPVFISYYQEQYRKCANCDVVYGPLIYQPSKVVLAEHWHEDEDSKYCLGGVFYDSTDAKPMPIYLWTAILSPIGSMRVHGSERRARGVLIDEIKINCWLCPLDGTVDNITEGFVVGNGDLTPICSPEIHPELAYQPNLSFKVTENNQVLFSQV